MERKRVAPEQASSSLKFPARKKKREEEVEVYRHHVEIEYLVVLPAGQERNVVITLQGYRIQFWP